MGRILSIERCSMHDGPGIRTTVFFKGCPLRCLWCHNPESQAFEPELYYLRERCRFCAACVAACRHSVHAVAEGEHELDRERCAVCGRCVEACPAQALEIKGSQWSVAEIMSEVEKDRAYYDSSGGGLTVSGGEPTSQYDFCRALLAQARTAGIHTCLETCAATSARRLTELARLVDLWLIDWKETDPALHERYTGVDNARIRENILSLDAAGAEILLRCPIVPGLNDREDHLAGIAELAGQMRNIRGIEVMAYHPMGASKSRAIGRTYPLEGVDYPEAAEVDRWRAAIAAGTDAPVS